MPYRTIAGAGTRYALRAFDAEGRERTDDPDAADGSFSRKVLNDIASERPTDIFILCHGWKGDIPASLDQYDRWIAAMDRSPDRSEAEERRPKFKPFRIGVHWPSQPWGDEELGSGAGAFDGSADPIALYVDRFGDRPGLRERIATVFRAAALDPAADRLPPDADSAYRDIDGLLTEMGSSGVAAPPGGDREPFDPQVYFEASLEEESFGFGSRSLGGILAPLRQLSFWKMKSRAQIVGEGGMHALLRELQSSSAGTTARVHLMGHSFGCIVVSGMLCGRGTADSSAKSVASLALIQGALSHWSYCGEIPDAVGRQGYFRGLLDDRLVKGPIVTTRSIYDTAVGRYYPLAAGVANQIEFAAGEPPRYGALGAFGAQGLDPEAIALAMKPANESYGLEQGRIYNVEASRYIRNGDGASGAHNDIDGPEVAHLIWAAALAGK